MTIFMAGSLSEDFFCRGHYLVRLDAEFFQQILKRRGRAKAVHSDDLALEANVALPAKRGSHFDRNACAYACGKDTFLIRGVLLLEEFPGRHADHSSLDPSGIQFFTCFDTQRNLAATAHEDHVWFPSWG